MRTAQELGRLGDRLAGSRRLGVWALQSKRGGQEQGHGRSLTLATGGTIQAVVADFRQALGQDVLEKAFYKLGHRKPGPLDLLGAVVPVAKGNVALFQAFQA